MSWWERLYDRIVPTPDFGVPDIAAGRTTVHDLNKPFDYSVFADGTGDENDPGAPCRDSTRFTDTEVSVRGSPPADMTDAVEFRITKDKLIRECNEAWLQGFDAGYAAALGESDK